jgi:hypothetical protein
MDLHMNPVCEQVKKEVKYNYEIVRHYASGLPSKQIDWNAI